MDTDRGHRDGWVPLREFGAAEQAGREEGPGAHRDGIRQVRQMSNWTAAALIVGTGAAAVALAHHALPAATAAAQTGETGTVAGAAGQASGTRGAAGAEGQAGGRGATAGTAASARGASAPQVAHSVATTTASGVTVTTTTRTVNGKTVVTRARQAPPGADN